MSQQNNKRPEPGASESSGSQRSRRDRSQRRSQTGRRQGRPQGRQAEGTAKPTKYREEPLRPGQDLVLVQFKGHRKGYYNNERGIAVKAGHYCLVEADRGQDMGRVVYIGPGREDWWNVAQRQGVVAVAGAKDLERLHDNRGDEWQFWDICQEKIQNRRLNMSLVSVERQFDHKKITFFFTAEKRVDFRDLVRDLAAVFRTRIELRQIGVRDEARLKGGVGVCGREFCCSSFLHEFVPVTLKMAKVQQLPLNPGKLSGLCGRLRCCMTYEYETYRESRRTLPRPGADVITPVGPAVVRKVDLLRRTVGVSTPDSDTLETFDVEQVTWEKKQDLPPARQRRSKGKGRSGGCGSGQGDCS